MTIINEEFLDLNSVAFNVDIDFRFGGFEMNARSEDLSRLVFSIGKLELEEGTIDAYFEKERFIFQAGFNEETDKPMINWSTAHGLPEDIDIRTAADVCVALCFENETFGPVLKAVAARKGKKRSEG